MPGAKFAPILVECKNCGHEWMYGGQSMYYCTCPVCHYKNLVPLFGERWHVAMARLAQLMSESGISPADEYKHANYVISFIRRLLKEDGLDDWRAGLETDLEEMKRRRAEAKAMM